MPVPQAAQQHTISTVLTQLPAPQTGREFAIRRIALGVSVRQVAYALGATCDRVRRWECSREALDGELVARWRAALDALATSRARNLSRQGFTPQELALLGMGAILGG